LGLLAALVGAVKDQFEDVTTHALIAFSGLLAGHPNNVLKTHFGIFKRIPATRRKDPSQSANFSKNHRRLCFHSRRFLGGSNGIRTRGSFLVL